MRWLAIAAALLGACHATSSPAPDTGPTHAVIVETLAVDFIAYRTGGGPWQTPMPGQAGYTLTVGDDYVLLLVCDNAGTGSAFDAEEFALTFHGDGPNVYPRCLAPALPPDGLPVTVTGTMVQPGTVHLAGMGSSSTTAPWTYSFDTTTGRYDVLAVDTAGNAVFDKDLRFAPSSGSAGSDTSAPGPSIDTSAMGAPLGMHALAISNVGTDALRVSSDVVSTEDSVIADGSDLTLLTMPESELGPGDVSYVDIHAIDATGEREAYADVEGSDALPASYDLLPPFTTAALDVTTAGAHGSWAALPADTADVELEIIADDNSTETITASPSYLAAGELTALEFDDTAPGYLDAWRLDPTRAATDLAALVYDDPDNIYYFSIAYGPATTAARDARSSRTRRQSPNR